MRRCSECSVTPRMSLLHCRSARSPILTTAKLSRTSCTDCARARLRRTKLSGATCTRTARGSGLVRSEEHTSELQSPCNILCRLLLATKKSESALAMEELILNFVEITGARRRPRKSQENFDEITQFWRNKVFSLALDRKQTDYTNETV